jgi:hypothetical protein
VDPSPGLRGPVVGIGSLWFGGLVIRQLHLYNVGPSPRLSFDFAPRLNLLAGDNGLGKTFVLDVLWWVLAGRWVGEPALPFRPPGDHHPPELSDGSGWGGGSGSGAGFGDGSGYGGGADSGLIEATLSPRGGEPVRRLGLLEPETQIWRKQPSAHVPALGVYARIDGSFAVWDAYLDRSGEGAAISLDASELWEGKSLPSSGPERARIVCRGLLADWVSWQGTRAPEFESLRRVLAVLSEPDEPLVPGPPARVRLDDRRDIPTLALSYANVPVTLASAGVRRVLSLAYTLVWAWSEHTKLAALTRRPRAQDLVLLVDEVELHLHPRWQRLLLPAVLQAIEILNAEAAVQIVASTHSPLVLASVEPIFREDSDDLHVLQPGSEGIVAKELTFAKQGDAANWLVSETFGLGSSRSAPSEAAIRAATAFMRGKTTEAEEALATALGRAGEPHRPLKERIHEALVALLPDHDTFWPRWVVSYEGDGAARR